MGINKKESLRTKTVSGKPRTGPDGGKRLTRVKGENFYRDAKKLKYLNMLKGGRAVRNAKGEIVKEARYQSSKADPARVEPNRKWFGNTRVVGQKQLDVFKDEMQKKVQDPHLVLLRQNKLPMSLISDPRQKRVSVIDTQPFNMVFGPNAQRKRPKIQVESLEQLSQSCNSALKQYEPMNDGDLPCNQEITERQEMREPMFMKGQSKRIRGELHKVVDSSDVVLHVLDARDPMGTRCKKVESFIRKECPHKHLMYIINKCDLVPSWAASKWVSVLNKEAPTIAFHASMSNSFGKGSLIQLLRQYAKLHPEKKQISVGLIGYPNTGKSSIINTLKNKKVCNVAPIPGETKTWQYITLMKRIYLIDCPGVVYPSNDTESDIVLKGVVRIENLKTPEDYIPDVLARVKQNYISKTYGIQSWESPTDFLEQLAKKCGRLLKAGEPDISTASKMVLSDWIRGRIPFFTAPPDNQTE